jgi:hypothetical protein
MPDEAAVPKLDREARPSPRRFLRAFGALACCVGVCAALAALAAVSAPAEIRPVVEIAAAPPPAAGPHSYTLSVPIHVDIQSTAAAPQRFGGPCPAPIAGADRAVGRARGAEDDRDYQLSNVSLVGVSASPALPGVLVAWDSNTVYLSTDDGRSFERVLTPPGPLRNVRVDCHGDVFALASPNWLGHRAAGGGERWREVSFLPSDVPGEDEDPEDIGFAVGGGTVGFARVLYGEHAIVALSSDFGETWRFHRIDNPGIEYLREFDIDDRGAAAVAVSLGDCMWDGLEIVTIDPTGKQTSSGDLTSDFFLGFGNDQWAYIGREYEVCDAALCALAPGSDAARAIRKLPVSVADASSSSSVIRGGRGAYLAARDRVYRVSKRALREHGAGLPDDVAFVAADTAGRLLGIDHEHGRLVRWSRKHGARELAGTVTDAY